MENDQLTAIIAATGYQLEELGKALVEEVHQVRKSDADIDYLVYLVGWTIELAHMQVEIENLKTGKRPGE